MSRAEDLVKRAAALGVTLTTAESCTGGMIAAAITDIPGSSAVFERGFVTYSNVAKSEMIGVLDDTLAQHGAVSEEVAREMALGARHAAKADYAIAITGIAGPGGSEHKPEGRVCFGLASPSGVTTELHDFGALGRQHVRSVSRDYALKLLIRALPDN
ncbi:MAG: CinA family protein [Aliishimia sp.]